MADVTFRKLEESDIMGGFLESLDSLRKASDLSEEKAKEISIK